MMRIRQINVHGNDKTKDNVIRRELRVDEQDVIDTPSLKRSFQRLNNLNFFETVEILPQQVDVDKVDLNVRVKEKPTGQFSIGGGFSTLDKLVAIADITEGNLGGNGWMGRIRGQLGQQRTLGLITFRNPYLNDSLTSLQLDVYRSMTNYITYFEEKSGASITFGRWLSEYVTGSISFVAEAVEFQRSDDRIAPEIILEPIGQANHDRIPHDAGARHTGLFSGPANGLADCRGFRFRDALFGRHEQLLSNITLMPSNILRCRSIHDSPSMPAMV